jgi:hypothetical protein
LEGFFHGIAVVVNQNILVQIPFADSGVFFVSLPQLIAATAFYLVQTLSRFPREAEGC